MEDTSIQIENLSGNGARPPLGVLGGLGPLASAEFLKTIYEVGVVDREQQSPVVLMYSDPTFPDRTDTLLSGSSEPLLSQLIGSLEKLCSWNISRIVICCVTIHHLLPSLPGHLREKVISLLDVILARSCEIEKPLLLLCTNGARRMNLFQRHRDWERARQFIVLPDGEDQEAIHELIYKIKSNHDPLALCPTVEVILAKYQVEGFIIGCTELHLLAKQFMARKEQESCYECVDPLFIIARQLTENEPAALPDRVKEGNRGEA